MTTFLWLPTREDEETPISCLTCMDTGYCKVEVSDIEIPCIECPRGDWTWGHELADDARMGR